MTAPSQVQTEILRLAKAGPITIRDLKHLGHETTIRRAKKSLLAQKKLKVVSKIVINSHTYELLGLCVQRPTTHWECGTVRSVDNAFDWRV